MSITRRVLDVSFFDSESRMSKNGTTLIPEVLERNESGILADWIAAQKAAPTYRPDLMKEAELRDQSREFLRLMTKATRLGVSDINAPAWQDVRELLASISR